MYKTKICFLAFILIFYQGFFVGNDVVVVRLRKYLTNYNYFKESKLDSFIFDCKWALLEDAKLSIMEAFLLQENNDDCLILLQDLKVKLEDKIQAIQFQITNNCQVDANKLNESIVASSLFFVLSYLTYASYTHWLLPNQTAFKDIKKDLDDKGIIKREYTRYYGSYQEHITEFIAGIGCHVDYNNYPELQQQCKKYLSLKGKVSIASFCTVGLGIISAFLLLCAMHSVSCCATLDLNQDNKYLSHYQSLFDFVVLLQKEFQGNQGAL